VIVKTFLVGSILRSSFRLRPSPRHQRWGVSVKVTALRTSKIYRSMLQRIRLLIRRSYFGNGNRFATARTIDDEVPLSRLGRRHLARLLFAPTSAPKNLLPISTIC